MRYSAILVLLLFCQPRLSFAFDAKNTEDGSLPSEGLLLDETAPVVPESPGPVVALRYELLITTALITAWGIYGWKWFQTKPHFNYEYGFSNQSATGGADKVAHAFDGFFFSDLFCHQLRKKGFSRSRSAFWGAVASLIVMGYIEIGDMTSAYGFSLEDLAADLAGTTLSWATNRYPTVDKLIDFRLSYFPSSAFLEGGGAVADYSGMKFNVALMFAGMGPVGRTPLRFIEFHLGYYTRGFRPFDGAEYQQRVLYVGLGLNLIEFLRPGIPRVLEKPVTTLLTYFQIPYTSWEAYQVEGRGELTKLP